MKKKYRIWILPLFAAVTFLLARVGIMAPEIFESIYSNGIYPVFAFLLSNLSGIFPFSLDDVFYIILILLIPILILLLFLKKLFLKRCGIFILQILSLVFIVFYWFWGFNYFRQNLNTRLRISESSVNSEVFESVFKELILSANNSFVDFNDFSEEDADKAVEESYKTLSSFFKVKYSMGKRRAKKITFSRFFASAGISGYYGPFFNEVHVNKCLLPAQYPVILAHEKAHQFGITSEAEANFYAWLVCSQSNDKELKYSADLYVLRYFLSQGRNLENYREYVNLLDQRVKNDVIKIEEYWSELRNEKIDETASKVNNAYLKSNNIKKGIQDYRGVVKFVIDFKNDSLALQKVKQLQVLK